MKTSNLAELYGAPPMTWEDVRARLDRGFSQAPAGDDRPGEDPGRHTTWLTTVNPDGSPHVTALGALWLDGTYWFETGRTSRKGRNIERDPRCAVALSLRELDLVVEGRAVLVTDPTVVSRLARAWAEDDGWPCTVDESGTALTAPFSAQSAGPPPWHVYRLDIASAQAVQTIEPYGATRWRF
jgi:hypothetical protein